MTTCRPFLSRGAATISTLTLLFAATGCDGSSDSGTRQAEGSSYEQTTPPTDQPVIEESDLYRLEGTRLYVQSERAGLTVIDVSRSTDPAVMARVPNVVGKAGELYVRGQTALVVFKEASCNLAGTLRASVGTTSQLVAVTPELTSPSQSNFGVGGANTVANTGGHSNAGTNAGLSVSAGAASTSLVRETASAASRLCLPGTLVGSRLIGNTLYLVTAYEALGASMSWVATVDVENPSAPEQLDLLAIDRATREIHVTDAAIYLVQGAATNGSSSGTTAGATTAVVYVDISGGDGVPVRRGAIEVEGAPAGRFHIDARGSYLRLVTRGALWEGSYLHVIDTSNPDRMGIVGELHGIGKNEELHATHFEGDTAYVVTYESVVYQRDPLWIISLANPNRPAILSSLEVPGWSDYVFPRGDRLVAVGRGDRGQSVAVALYDVSQPGAPTQIDSLDIGAADATSAANTDHRAVTIIESELASPPLLVVPYTNNIRQSDGSCLPMSYVQLVDLQRDALVTEGALGQLGVTQRTLATGGSLLAIGANHVTSIEVANRASPVARGKVVLSQSPEACTWNSFPIVNRVAGGNDRETVGLYACNMGRAGNGRWAFWGAVFATVLVACRRREASSRRRSWH